MYKRQKQYCSDYEIIRWDESNYNIEKFRYAKEAYEAKKWSFVADVARLDIINQYGGIALDTDVEVVRSLDPLLYHRAFCGKQKDQYINTGLGFGAIKGYWIVENWLETYKNRSFIDSKGIMNLTACPIYQTLDLINMGYKHGDSKLDEMVIYPSTYFDPKDYYSEIIEKKCGAYTIHHYEASWLNEEEKKKQLKLKKNIKMFEKSILNRIYKNKENFE